MAYITSGIFAVISYFIGYYVGKRSEKERNKYKSSSESIWPIVRALKK